MPTFGQQFDPMQFIALMAQIQQGNQRNAESRFGTALQQATPGTTYGQLGLSNNTLKRALGRVPGADEMAKQMTPEYALQQKQMEFINNAPPELINVLSATRSATSSGAPQGLYTSEGVVHSAKANEAEAGTKRKIEETTSGSKVQAAQAQAQTQATSAKLISEAVEEGYKSWQNFAPEIRKLIGEKAAMGITGNEAAGADASTQLQTALKREALKATIDPKHPANNFFRGLGIDPAAGYAMLGAGAEQLLTLQAQLTVTSKASESALAKADVAWAEQIGKQFGIQPSQVLAGVNRVIHQGGEPKTDFEKTLVSALQTVFNASINKAAEEGDPEASNLSALITAIPKLAGDRSALRVMTEATNRKVAIIQLHQAGIPNPTEAQIKAQAAKYTNILNDGWWSGFKLNTPAVGTQQMQPQQEGGGLTGGLTGLPPMGASMPQQMPQGGISNSMSLTVPQGLAPDTAKAVQLFLDALGTQRP